MLQLAPEREVRSAANSSTEPTIRLAYVQHPFPAQGQTTDTAHLIVSEHTTQEGSYVALTRAGEQTHIHASREQLGARSQRRNSWTRSLSIVGRSEPEVPSIRYPLAHEALVHAEQERELERERSQEQNTALERTEREVEGSKEAGAPSAERMNPKQHLTAGPGEPPGTAARRAARRHAVAAIARYRVRYAIGDLETGPPGEEPAPGYFERRYQRNEAAAEALEALTELDPENERDRELQERGLDTLGLGRGSKARDRSVGWEP